MDYDRFIYLCIPDSYKCAMDYGEMTQQDEIEHEHRKRACCASFYTATPDKPTPEEQEWSTLFLMP